MAVTKVGGGDVVPDRNVRSQAPALALTARSLAGRSRQVHELAVGKNPIAHERPATKRNPQQRLGHDHSGPPWGSSFLHPIAWAMGLGPEADVEGERDVIGGIHAASSPLAFPPWAFWVPPFDHLPAPYVAPRARLHLYFRAETDVGTSNLTVRLASDEQSHPLPREASATFALTTTESGYSNADLFLDVVPGYNRALLSFEADDVTAVCRIIALSLCVRVKRSH